MDIANSELFGKLKLANCASMGARWVWLRSTRLQLTPASPPDFAMQHDLLLFPDCIINKSAAPQQAQFRF
jgi:hypothetical protein